MKKNQNLNKTIKLKKSNIRGKIKHLNINRLMVFHYENLLVIEVLFDLNLKDFRI